MLSYRILSRTEVILSLMENEHEACAEDLFIHQTLA
jgi:hypothetical protein